MRPVFSNFVMAKIVHKKFILSLVGVLLIALCLGGCGADAAPTAYDDPYNAEAAVAYSYRYALVRNEDYANLETNCTNYISQILIAGGKQMDEAPAPVANERITYDNTDTLWYCTSIHTDPNRWKEFRLSTSFCRTEDFFRYWTQVRGMEFREYAHSMAGLLQLYEDVRVGDILTFFDENGALRHLSVVVKAEDNRILVNANTTDYMERNILEVSSSLYPKIGILMMK